MITTEQIVKACEITIGRELSDEQIEAGIKALTDTNMVEEAYFQLITGTQPLRELATIMLACVEIGMQIKENETVKKGHD